MNTKLFYLFLLVFLAIGVRIAFGSLHPAPILNADSYGYYGVGKSILDKPKFSTFVNKYRVPIYPLLLAGVVRTISNGTASLDSAELLPGISFVILFQATLGVLGIALLYLILIDLSLPVICAFFISAILALQPSMLIVERAIMSDSLATFFVIIMTYLLVKIIQKPTKVRYITLGIISLLAWLTRPNVLLVPAIALPLLLLAKQQQRFIGINLTVLFFVLISVLFFVAGNTVWHEYRGISQVNEINLLGRILEFHLPVESGKSYERYYNAVIDYRNKSGPAMPYRLLDSYDPMTYVDSAHMRELQQFDRAVISTNIASYMVRSLSYIPKVFFDTHPLGISLWPALQKIYQFIGLMSMTIFILWPFAIWRYSKKHNWRLHLAVIVGAITISQIFVIVFLDYYDAGQYARLATSTQAPLYLFFSLFLADLL